MLRYLSVDLVRSKKRTIFREFSSRKTVNFEAKIMSEDKISEHILQPYGGYCTHLF